MSAELLPCPFCGNEYPSKVPGRDYVMCQQCEARGPSGLSSDPIADWNTRATTDTDRQRDELLAALTQVQEWFRHGVLPDGKKPSVFIAEAIANAGSGGEAPSELEAGFNPSGDVSVDHSRDSEPCSCGHSRGMHYLSFGPCCHSVSDYEGDKVFCECKGFKADAGGGK